MGVIRGPVEAQPAAAAAHRMLALRERQPLLHRVAGDGEQYGGGPKIPARKRPAQELRCHIAAGVELPVAVQEQLLPLPRLEPGVSPGDAGTIETVEILLGEEPLR